MTPAAPLTDHELSMLERAQTELEWNQAVVLIGEARNHEMPSDWVERVHTSGLEQRSKQKFLLQRQQRTPFWEEMTWLKDQFFDPSETVLQFHVPKDQHINTHEHVLHLWRPIAQQIPLPPPILV